MSGWQRVECMVGMATAFVALLGGSSMAQDVIEVSPAHLLAESRSNPQAFNAKYGGKTVQFRGTLNFIQFDHLRDLGFVSIFSCTTGAPCPDYHCCGMSYCVVYKNTAETLQKLAPTLRGKELTAHGVYRRMYGSFPAFDECSIAELKP